MIGGEDPQAARAERVVGEPLHPYEPTVVGQYQLISRLGEGGMGTVYLARDRTGRPVAVKVVRPDLASSEEFRRRFRAETEAARRVAPFCTAEVLDADPGARMPYMVTEFIDGVRLDHEVSTNGPLSPSTLTGTAVGVATALTAIHRAGLVHRDLKPSNVILSISGPRVIDFGIAQALEGAVVRPTKWGFGSAGWMAPEQINGESIGPAADVFVWGILIAYAGTGRHPFGEGSDVDLSYRIVTAAPDLTGLPSALADLVSLAMAKRPDDRPTARDLLLRLVERDPGEPGSGPIGSAEQVLGLGPASLGEAPGVVSPTRTSNPSLGRADSRGHPGPPSMRQPAALGDGYGPTPGHRPPMPDSRRPGRRRPGRRTVVMLALFLILVAIAVGLVVSNPDGGSESGPSASPTGSPTTAPSPSASSSSPAGPRDGQLAFTVTDVRCGESRSGIIFAGGGEELCVVDVTVRNVGGSARSFTHDQQFLVDSEGERYKASALDLVQFVPILEDGSADRTLVFEVPDGTEPDHLELQDSDNDGGVPVPL